MSKIQLLSALYISLILTNCSSQKNALQSKGFLFTTKNLNVLTNAETQDTLIFKKVSVVTNSRDSIQEIDTVIVLQDLNNGQEVDHIVITKFIISRYLASSDLDQKQITFLRDWMRSSQLKEGDTYSAEVEYFDEKIPVKLRIGQWDIGKITFSENYETIEEENLVRFIVSGTGLSLTILTEVRFKEDVISLLQGSYKYF